MYRRSRGIDGFHPPGTSFEINRRSHQAYGLYFWLPVLDSNGAKFLVDKALGLPGTFYNAASIVQDYANARGYILNGGDDDYVSFGTPACLTDLAVGKALSTTCWHYSTGNVAGAAHIIDKRDPGKGWRVYRNRVTNQRISARTECATTDAYTYANAGTWTEDQWNLIVATYNDVGDRKWRIYVNGVELSYGGQTAGVGTAGADSTMPLQIGDDAAGYGLRGRISDIRIYTRVLPIEEAKAMWNPNNRWDLYLPIKKIYPVVVAAPAVGQPTMLRNITVPGTRQWQPQFPR